MEKLKDATVELQTQSDPIMFQIKITKKLNQTFLICIPALAQTLQ